MSVAPAVAAGEGSTVTSAVAIGLFVGGTFVAIGDAVGLTLIVFAEQPAITMLAATMHSRAKNHFFT